MNTSSYLFSTPSFFEGVGRLVDFGSTLNNYNFSKSGRIADCKALKSDWYAIGNDMREVIESEAKKTISKK